MGDACASELKPKHFFSDVFSCCVSRKTSAISKCSSDYARCLPRTTYHDFVFKRWELSD